MPKHPQPVPPIFQPEIAADSIVHAAYSGRREVWVGYPTVQAILVNGLLPGLADRYAARVGYDAQQTEDRVDPDRPSNLQEPLSGDYGARGEFSDRARSFSWQWWANKHRGWLLAAAAAGLVATCARRCR